MEGTWGSGHLERSAPSLKTITSHQVRAYRYCRFAPEPNHQQQGVPQQLSDQVVSEPVGETPRPGSPLRFANARPAIERFTQGVELVSCATEQVAEICPIAILNAGSMHRRSSSRHSADGTFLPRVRLQTPLTAAR